MINPTGKKIRNDREGFGYYGAPRGHRVHKGTDFECDPFQEVKAPISGVVTRKVYAYADDPQWTGVEIEGERGVVKLLYINPLNNILGKTVSAGDIVGYAQDISKRYSPDMTPHVHLEIVSLDPMCLVEV